MLAYGTQIVALLELKDVNRKVGRRIREYKRRIQKKNKGVIIILNKYFTIKI